MAENLASHMTVEMATQLHMAAAAGQAPNVIPMPADFSMPPPTAVPWGIRPQHNYVNQPFQSMSLEVKFLFTLFFDPISHNIQFRAHSINRRHRQCLVNRRLPHIHAPLVQIA